MNEARVRRLAREGRVEVTRKILKRFTRDGQSILALVSTLTVSEIKDEDVLAYPDFTCALGIPDKNRPYDLLCVQSGDGTTVRLVGMFKRVPKTQVTQSDES